MAPSPLSVRPAPEARVGLMLGTLSVPTRSASAASFGMSLGAALGGLALAGYGYFALGMCTVALPLAAAILVWFRCLGPRTAIDNLISSRAD